MSTKTNVHMVGGIPRAGSVVSMSLSLFTVAALAVCLSKYDPGCWIVTERLLAQRIQVVHSWTKLPVLRWCESSSNYALLRFKSTITRMHLPIKVSRSDSCHIYRCHDIYNLVKYLRAWLWA